MKKYRIQKITYPSGWIQYKVQKRFLGCLFWFNWLSIDPIQTGYFDTLGQAERAIEIEMNRTKNEIIKTY